MALVPGDAQSPLGPSARTGGTGRTHEKPACSERSRALPWPAASGVLLGSSFALLLLGGEL